MTTKSFIKTIGQKGLLADYNTSGKKLQTEDSIDQTYSPTSTKAQSGVAVNEAFKTRETSASDDSYTYLGMLWSGSSTEKLYWKLVSFKPTYNYWTLQFEIDVCNGRNGNRSFDTEIYETKRLTIYSGNKDTVENAIELRYTSQSNNDSRGYGNNIYYAMDSSGTVTIYIYAANSANKSQICRLTSVRNAQSISNITWYEPVADAGTQPTNPVKFKEAFPAIASTLSDIGSDSVPVYINKGKPVSCNSSNLKAGKDDDGNVIKNTYQKKLTFDTTPTADSTNPVTSGGIYKSMYTPSKPTKPSVFTKDGESYSFVCRCNVNVWSKSAFEGYAYPADYQVFDMIRIRTTVYDVSPTDSAYISVTCGKRIYDQYNFVQAIYNGYCYVFATKQAFYPLFVIPNKFINSDMNSSFITQDIFETLLLSKINPTIDDVLLENTPKDNSTNPITSGGVKSAIDNVKNTYQKKLTFDSAPTAGSNNPVTSDGIKTALDSRIPAPTSTTGTQVLKCIDGVIQWVTE